VTDYEESREIDRALRTTTDPAEMRRLITRRRLIRASLEFQHTIDQIARDVAPGPVEPACLTSEEWRRLGRI
jgi:hypothetical protein